MANGGYAEWQRALAFGLKREAVRLGFDHLGIAQAGFLEDEAPQLEAWLARNAHGDMAYMADQADDRLDPRRLLPGAQTVVCVLKNYFPDPEGLRLDAHAPRIAKYAWGRDYHFVLKERLHELAKFIRREVGTDFAYRMCVDSAPVMDKAWARRAGLGWLGKNTNIIRPGYGSFFFLGELLIDIALPPDHAITDHCGTCTRCIDACPTQALSPYEIDATRCISYLTIEREDALPSDLKDKLEGWAFGCDICQDVCPWNHRFAVPHQEPAFEPLSRLIELRGRNWHTDPPSKAQYERAVRRSPMRRVRYPLMAENFRLTTSAESVEADTDVHE